MNEPVAIFTKCWVCVGKCKRAWPGYSPWTVRDTVRDFPRFVREQMSSEPLFFGIFGVACAAFATPVWLAFEVVQGPRCPACGGRLEWTSAGRG